MVAEILVKRAVVAILDEPTSGLDPQSTRDFLDLIRSLKADGMTILLSSHLLDQVQSICDRVALFNKGRIGLSGRVDTLLSEVLGGSHVIRLEAKGTGLAEAIGKVPGVSGGAILGDGLTLVTRKDAPLIAQGMDAALLALSRSGRLNQIYLRYFPNGL